MGSSLKQSQREKGFGSDLTRLSFPEVLLVSLLSRVSVDFGQPSLMAASRGCRGSKSLIHSHLAQLETRKSQGAHASIFLQLIAHLGRGPSFNQSR